MSHEKKAAKQWSDYFNAIMCGLTGSLAALFAKAGIQPSNSLYRYFDTVEYGNWINILFRVIFIMFMLYSNVKMVENKIRSFALIGASITVVIAFLANYVFNLSYELFIYHKLPQVYQYLGSLLMLAGIFVQKDQVTDDYDDFEITSEISQEKFSTNSRLRIRSNTHSRKTNLQRNLDSNDHPESQHILENQDYPEPMPDVEQESEYIAQPQKPKKKNFLDEDSALITMSSNNNYNGNDNIIREGPYSNNDGNENPEEGYIREIKTQKNI